MRPALLVSMAVSLLALGCTADPDVPPLGPRTSAELTSALVTEGDLAGEGVVARVESEQKPFLGACVPDSPSAHALARWTLREDRAVTHAVETYRRPADMIDALRDREVCLEKGMRTAMGPVLGALDVDAQHSWCLTEDDRHYRCGGVVAKGDLLVIISADAVGRNETGTIVANLFPAALRGVERVGVRPSKVLPADPTPGEWAPGDPSAALLTLDDLAGEGEVRSLKPPAASVAQLCLLATPEAQAIGSWRLADGSVVVHSVESYENAAGQVRVFTRDSRCTYGDGRWEPGPEWGHLDVHVQVSWCSTRPGVRGCGGVVVRGDLMSTVVVAAETTAAARAAVARLMPLAVAALDRV
ncbi:hypothetical protein [Actinokineospora fastidiosa]|uniref:Uncharacterized protein n=1 Tax=Actinokineospora fastidiosa TaxID=1816 RepID=A0A918GSX5_9PSEU|nr:hypothetical protein [Actinokineospora fastidiosa]GGS56014.1 hypothetical protein GCM10010171_58720 [Actinokineospora fastidiosa]